MLDLSQELLTSSARFPRWQQDALRRLITGKLSDDDYVELVALAKTEHLPGTSTSFQAIPLALDHLSRAQSGEGETILLSMFDVEGVNALAPEQRLDFGPEGITIVFGRNGAGKSGYSRVLRRACRARKAPTILPNVMKPGPIAQPRAKFAIRTTSGDAEILWRQDLASPAELARIAVFDRECEKGIVDEQGEAAFAPMLLARFDELARVVEEVKRQLVTEETASRPTDDLEDLKVQLSGSNRLELLVASIIPGQSEKEYTRVASETESVSWSADQDEGLKQAKDRLLMIGDPLANAKSLRTFASSLQQIKESLEETDSLIGRIVEENLRISKHEAQTLNEAALKAESGIDFSKEPAANIGKLAWQNLYNSAVTFSISGLPDALRFPSPEAKCPLCLQDLDVVSKARFHSFHAFMTNEMKAASDKAQALLKAHTDRIRQISFAAPAPQVTHLFEEHAQVSATVLSELPQRIKDRCEAILRNLEMPEWDRVPDFPYEVLEKLTTLTHELERKAIEIEKLTDIAARHSLELEVNALESTRIFVAQRPRLRKVIEQHRTAARLERVIDKLNTNTISREGKRVAELAVSSGLKDLFSQEMIALGADGIHADIAPKVAKGKPTFGIELAGTMAPHKVGNVLSEGEQRVIALAYFLAEVQVATDKIGIIIDDPVSSLDYWWAERIAQRIADLGVDRQVIVFTHSIALAVEIEKHAAFTRAAVTKLFIERGADGAGHCSPEAAPWKSMPIDHRMKFFKSQIIVLRAEFQKSPAGQSYATQVAQFCGDLRSGWERAVEELVFRGVIERFGPSISTGRLKEVVCTNETFVQVNEAMTKLSAFTNAHDKAQDAFSTCPRPDELSVLVDKLAAFIAYQKNESKKALEERKPLDSALSVQQPKPLASIA